MVADEMFKNGNAAEGRRILSDIGAELTAAGQLGQANRILRGSDVQTKAAVIEKMVEKLNENLNQRQKNKNIKKGVGDEKGRIVVPDDLLNEYSAATTDEARNEALDKIEQTIADQIPPTFADKFTALRYLNMLGNFKTQIRNLVGNAAMGVEALAKRKTQAVAELAATLATGGKYERTTSLNPKGFRAAWNDFTNVADEAMGEGKYSNDVSQLSKGVRDKQKVFRSKALNAYRGATTWAMEAGDKIFIRFHYADALAGWLNAHNVTLETATESQLQRAREFAIKEGQEATFHDNNAVSEWVSTFDKNWGKNADGTTNTFGQVAKTITQGVVPFRKTPANVAVRAVEYSPVGIAETIYKGINAAKGKGNAADVINSLAKNATGTALFFAGLLMQSAGNARGGGSDDDDDLNNFEKLQGAMDYSVKIGDQNVSMSQFAPPAVPFFMGVKFGEMGAITNVGDINKLLGCISDPMLDMSMLSGINDALDQLATFNDSADALPKFVANSMLNFLTQGVTNTLLGQLAQTLNENRQTVYSDNDSILGKDLQYKVAKIGQKIPTVDYNQQDYVDAWGRTQSNGTVAQRVFNNFLNPTYTSEDKAREWEKELQRLYVDNKDVSGFPSVLPQKDSRTMSIGENRQGEKITLTPDEYLKYSIDVGQKKEQLVSDFIQSAEYKSLSDEQRGEIISNLYSLAKTQALRPYLTSKNAVLSKSKQSDLEKASIIAGLPNPSDYYVANASMGKKENGDNKSVSVKQYAAFENAGITGADAAKALNAIDVDNKGSYSQEEVYSWLADNQGQFTAQQMSNIWSALTTGKTTLADYNGNRKKGNNQLDLSGDAASGNKVTDFFSALAQLGR